MATLPPSADAPPSPPSLSQPSQSDRPSPKALWSSLGQGISRSITDFQPDFDVINGTAKVVIPQVVVEESVPLWRCFVVGYFMGEAPHVGSIHATVNRIWTVTEKNAKIDVQFINKKTVLFRIESAKIREHVLKRRYWHIANVPLVINEWNPDTANPHRIYRPSHCGWI